ncbi:unnamed protein product [Enterobius vermicularis]|uniref:Mitogen-activated protein kinase kinase kinase n=1 Tax=Enterobius vermicularis TaxID=51028 RepID=A0A0N4UXU0_ENTVE|nr:unnamed protein product [Enterobius vermicularis]
MDTGNEVVPFIQSDLLKSTNHIGRGGFGEVRGARYCGESVAMKILENNSDLCKKQFINEMEQLYRLRHPNIIRVIGQCSCDGKLAFVMELMTDGSVDDIIHQHLRLSYKADHVISWAYQCADAVSFIHNKGLVHRDLKPNNLLLSDGYRILKLCDFGTVAAIKTLMTNNLGSPSWMAPENGLQYHVKFQVFRSHSYTDKCDVYSFGITLWEMFTRRRPFDNNATAFSILWQASHGHRPPVIRDPCPPVIMELISDCWNGTPEVRPSMKDVLDILSELRKVFPNGKDPLKSDEEECSEDRDPIASQNTRLGNEDALYSDQIEACKELYETENRLVALYKIKHDLIAKLKRMEETAKLIEKKESLLSQLNTAHERICRLKQAAPNRAAKQFFFHRANMGKDGSSGS